MHSFDFSGEDLATLMSRSAARRDAAWGRMVTYSRKVFIPLTNLCLDKCGYCVFARPPEEEAARYMTPEEVLAVAERGRTLGCKEALFSLGERPELRHAKARESLARLGYETTIAYLRAMCALVLEKTGLLPHANPGALSESELRSLMPVAGSMGMMLENISERLMEPGQAHFQCPDKHPVRRIATLEAAGRLKIPFTTGILIGIGETWEERIATLEAIARIHHEFGHIQEVIVQNFRAKPGIRAESWPEPPLDDMLRTIAAARLILPDEVSIQAPPNLMPDEYGRYIDAGLNDWGGVSPATADHINPERAWPKIAELADVTAGRGFQLAERLTIYPRYLGDPDRFVAEEMRGPIFRLAGADGLPAEQRLS
ncbi:MAG: 7,8-didemethyl-8-hydroxy-5-deazariboflavin synthase CofG [Candidatus Hydrogenedentota bacterium]